MARGLPVAAGKGADLRSCRGTDEVERAVIDPGAGHRVVDCPAALTEAWTLLTRRAGMGGLGIGVMVLPEDQSRWISAGLVPEDARSFGERDPALQMIVFPAGNRIGRAGVCRVPSADRRTMTEAEKGSPRPTVHRGAGAPIPGRSRSTPPLRLPASRRSRTRLVLGERPRAPDDTDGAPEAIADTLAPDDPPVHEDGRLRLHLAPGDPGW